MERVRGFSSQEFPQLGAREVQDAPKDMRQEVVAALYTVANQTIPFGSTNRMLDVDRDLYLSIEQSLGQLAAGSPVQGRRQRIGRDIDAADWRSVYDLIVGLWPEFLNAGVSEAYRGAMNNIFAAYRIAWDLGSDGLLHRVLPEAAAIQIGAAFAELANPRYLAALRLATGAQAAYDARPRRDRDACSNAFDAMESAAKVRFSLPTSTFGAVLAHSRRQGYFDPQTIDLLEKVNTLRNRHFGHGMTDPFNLKPAEVDLTYLTCIAGILLFTRI